MIERGGFKPLCVNYSTPGEDRVSSDFVICRLVSLPAIRIRRVLTTMTSQQSIDRLSKPAMIAFSTGIGLRSFPEWVRVGCRH
ncbi:MAG: hypothetical protein ACLQBD_24205 [Syntrophobacteraceae bacterium]